MIRTPWQEQQWSEVPSDVWWKESQAWTAQWHDEAWDEPAEVEPPSEEMEQAFKEALEAEKNAEALAMEARRTWAQAQQATAALRKDRGFGAQGVGKGDIRCWTCGGPHMSKDCPDRHHPRYQKGKGKHLSQAELDAYLFKGKGKSKPGGKSAHFQYGEEPWMSYDMNAFFKGKGHKAGMGKGKYRPSANVYGMDQLSYLELSPLELFSHVRKTSTWWCT